MASSPFRARPGGDDVELALAKARFGDDGGIAGGMAEWTAYEQALLKPPSFVQEQDLRILRLLRQLVRRNGLYAWPVLRGEEGYALFECALESGRAWLDPPAASRRCAFMPRLAARRDWCGPQWAAVRGRE